MVVWGGLEIAEKRREAKDKEKRKDIPIWKQSSKEKQERDKKAFLSDPCKEIEENNRMGKTRDLFEKNRDTKEHFMQRLAQ